MIGVFVRFRYDSSFDPKALREIAQGAKAVFEGIRGLRSKAFTLDNDAREAINFYVWYSEAAARAFFTEETIGKLAQFYGVRPTVTFVEIATLVDNHPKSG
jgi:hypothetical protein